MVGALLDAEAPDEFINNLLLSVRSLLPVDKLVEVRSAHAPRAPLRMARTCCAWHPKCCLAVLMLV